MLKFKKLFNFKQNEIKQAFQKAKIKAQNSNLILLQANFEKQPYPAEYGKLLIIASRKAGKAHERNLLKRRIKTIYYEHKLYAKPIISILIARKNAKNMDFKNLTEFLTKNI